MTIQVYVTEGENHQFQKVEPNQVISDKSKISGQTLMIDSKVKYQTMDGFGASFTDASSYLINHILKPEDREKVLKELFDLEEGIGISLLRNPIGASDYARNIYSFDDLEDGETDERLEKFSIAPDLEHLVPLLQSALKISNEIKIYASPWSAPAWMKTSASMKGGKLKKEFYPTYAHYFAKYIEMYQDLGIVIDAITPQNEPLYEPKHYPSMEMLDYEQVDFVKNYLKPLFVRKNISTKILGYDHNWDRIDYPIYLLDHASEAFDGIAWHWYGGRPVSQTRVEHIFPDKDVYFTEGSGGDWIPGFDQAYENLMRTGIAILRNNSKSLILWNIALDQHNGPTVPGFGKSTCRGLLTVNTGDRTYRKTQDYYGIAHFSKFIRPGATRLESSADDQLLNVVFENEDQSRVMVLYNDTEEDRTVDVHGLMDETLSLNVKSKASLTIVVS